MQLRTVTNALVIVRFLLLFLVQLCRIKLSSTTHENFDEKNGQTIF